MGWRLAGTFSLLLALAVPSPHADERRVLNVAVAADLRFAMDELVAGFESRHPGIFVKSSFGSSGDLFSQLQSEAPFDLFLSADAAYPTRLKEMRLAEGGVFFFAAGRIVIWAPASFPGPLEGLASLKNEAVKKIAIANPERAPYGRAAEAALRSAKVYDSVKSKLVLGKDVVQAAELADSGEADVGIIALSLALAPGLQKEGRFVQVPQSAYPPIAQQGVILKWAKDKDAAQAFREHLLGPSGKATLRKYGFSFPGD
jgi:molybdate transport system substrate-binding protein